MLIYIGKTGAGSKPILVAGVGLSMALWLWDSLHQPLMEIGQLTVLGAIALGTGFWLLQKVGKNKSKVQILSPMERETVEKAIAQANKIVCCLETEAPDRDISDFKQKIAQLPELLNRQELQIAVTGGTKVGKTTLLETLKCREIVEGISFVETEALFAQTEKEDIAAQKIALASDLVLFLTGGDLTDSEWQTLQKFRTFYGRIVLLFNKQDQYLPEERLYILQQLQHRVAEIIPPEDVLGISATGAEVKVRQHQEDGSVKEWMEKQQAEVGNLTLHLEQIINQEREQLVWATTWRKASELKTEAKGILNEIRRDRALPVIEQYQWIAAAAAFANPVAALDLLATAAVNAQMLVDLSGIYQQKFSLSQAQTASGTIGKLMVQLGLVELTTQAIASVLKSNAFTYVAGGAVQGVSAAYLTRLAGLSLTEYFQEQEVSITADEGLNLERLGEKLKQVFQQNQRTAFIQGFVKQAVARLSSEKVQAETPA